MASHALTAHVSSILMTAIPAIAVAIRSATVVSVPVHLAPLPSAQDASGAAVPAKSIAVKHASTCQKAMVMPCAVIAGQTATVATRW